MVRLLVVLFGVLCGTCGGGILILRLRNLSNRFLCLNIKIFTVFASEDITVDPAGVAKLLAKLNIHKASGPDGLNARVLKECSSEVAPVLAYIFNESLVEGVVPDEWRQANVTPVFKKGEKYDAANYRPVSLTCICCKTLEHILVSNINKHLAFESILADCQHGF